MNVNIHHVQITRKHVADMRKGGDGLYDRRYNYEYDGLIPCVEIKFASTVERINSHY
jgi:hypothetical protein